MSSGAVSCDGRRFDIAQLLGDRTNKKLIEHMAGRADYAGKQVRTTVIILRLREQRKFSGRRLFFGRHIEGGFPSHPRSNEG